MFSKGAGARQARGSVLQTAAAYVVPTVCASDNSRLLYMGLHGDCSCTIGLVARSSTMRC
jgi:hypothetical protein